MLAIEKLENNRRKLTSELAIHSELIKCYDRRAVGYNWAWRRSISRTWKGAKVSEALGKK